MSRYDRSPYFFNHSEQLSVESSRSIKEVKAKHQAKLMATEGVVSVGIGKNDEGALCIVVGVEQLGKNVNTLIPKQLEGFPVEVEQVGRIDAQ